ncbi:hypothetical protein D3C74_261390 [compost metagenome]
MVEKISPNIMVAANGLNRISPIVAIGIIPTIAVSEVSKIGRKRAEHAIKMASVNSAPSRRASSINSINTIPLRTTIPASEMIPIILIKPIGIPVIKLPSTPPAAARYTVVIIMIGVETE